MNGWTAILISVPITFVAAWFGGRFHALIASSHVRIQTMLSFVGGLMLGMALLHLVPHAIVQIGSIDKTMYGMLGGLIGVFLLIRFLHVHSKDSSAFDNDSAAPAAKADHDHTHEHSDQASNASSRLRWLVLLSGLGLHSVVDGLAIASAVTLACSDTGWAGFSILLVVLLHKPIDAVSLTGTMAAVGESPARRKLINVLFALITPLATVGAYAGFVSTGSGAGMAMAIAAGAFICVALADLMPEVQFHSHHRGRFTLALFLGIALSWAIGFFEPHDHHHAPGLTSGQDGHHHDHSGHNH